MTSALWTHLVKDLRIDGCSLGAPSMRHLFGAWVGKHEPNNGTTSTIEGKLK
jgi:hypothetical protein